MTEENLKKLVGKKAAEFVKDGMVIGLGTGSTARYFIEELGELVHHGMQIKGCATSNQSTRLAIQNKIPIVSLNKVDSLDLTVDGCDQFDAKKKIIKGLGGALLREKVIASLSKQWIVICDFTKKRETLGQGILPIEVIPVVDQLVLRQLEKMGLKGAIRSKNNIPYVTDNKNHIIDIQFEGVISKPEGLEQKIRFLPGVVETGFFLRMNPTILVGNENNEVEIIT